MSTGYVADTRLRRGPFASTFSAQRIQVLQRLQFVLLALWTVGLSRKLYLLEVSFSKLPVVYLNNKPALNIHKSGQKYDYLNKLWSDLAST